MLMSKLSCLVVEQRVSAFERGGRRPAQLLDGGWGHPSPQAGARAGPVNLVRGGTPRQGLLLRGPLRRTLQSLAQLFTHRHTGSDDDRKVSKN